MIPAGALRPALSQPMQLAKRACHATPVGVSLGWSAFNVFHHDQTVDEQSAVSGRDGHWDGHPSTFEVLESASLA